MPQQQQQQPSVPVYSQQQQQVQAPPQTVPNVVTKRVSCTRKPFGFVIGPVPGRSTGVDPL